MSQVLRGRQRRSFGSHVCLDSVRCKLNVLHHASCITYLGHSAIDDKVGSVDKAALVTGQENHRVGLFDGLTETACGEMHLTTETLGLVITKPVLQEGGAVIVRIKLLRQQAKHTSKEQGTGH